MCSSYLNLLATLASARLPRSSLEDLRHKLTVSFILLLLIFLIGTAGACDLLALAPQALDAVSWWQTA